MTLPTFRATGTGHEPPHCEACGFPTAGSIAETIRRLRAWRDLTPVEFDEAIERAADLLKHIE